MNRSLLRTCAIAALAIGIAGSLVSAPATAAPPSTTTTAVDTAALRAPVPAARPEVGDCHALSFKEGAAFTDPDPPVSCSRSHTSRTIKVLSVPRRIKLSNGDDVSRFSLRGCSPAIAATLGGSARSRALSAYDLAYFRPTRAQISQGTRFIRCDLILRGGLRLLALPTDRTPALGSLPHANGVALCLQIQRSGRFFGTACTRTHNHRARGSVQVDGDRYPGRDRFARIAARRCPGIVGSRIYFATWPLQITWVNAGKRRLICYSRGR